MQAAVYTRISKDKKEGAGLGVERQLADCRELATTLGWDIVAVFSDNDVSAYSGKHRPGYAALCEALEAGRAQGLLIWHADRLHRRPVELESFIDLAERKGIEIRTVKAGELDLSTSSGKMVARMLGAAARHEVEHMVERIKAQKKTAALKGEFRGSRRPFGYEPDGTTARPAEADAIRTAAEAVLSGVPLRQVARDWNASGLRTSFGKRCSSTEGQSDERRGKEFTATEVRRILLRPRNAAIVMHEGRPIAEGQWDAILDTDTHTALCGLLRDPDRRTNSGSEKRNQGTGVYICAKCGAPMKATANNKSAGTWRRTYTCSASKHLGRDAEHLDELVDTLVIGRLSMPDARIVLGQPVADGVGALYAERDNLRARLDALGTMFGAGEIDGGQLKKGSEEVKRRLRAVQGRLDAARKASAIASVVLAGDDLEQTWRDTSADVRSQVIDALMSVIVLPAPRGRRPGGVYFDPNTVRIVWKKPL